MHKDTCGGTQEKAQQGDMRDRSTLRKGTYEETYLEKQNGDVEGDIVGDMAGDVLMEGGAPSWRRYNSERTGAVGSPWMDRDTPEGLQLWMTHAEIGIPLRDCGPLVSHTGS